jgi:endonuclease/exonuclease/phosphatase (EEP) superfamily protein YafD
VIQEGVGHWGRELPAQLGASHPHVGPPKTGQIGTHRDGVWVLSASAPLSPAYSIAKAPEPGYIVRSEILFGDRAVALYAVHLPRDFEHESARLGRLTFLALTRALENEALPVILAGDFNATPSSWRMVRLRELGLRSAIELAGSGRGATWPAWAPGWAGVAIDHIMIGPELACRSVQIGEPMGSDHRPLVAEIGFRRFR